MSGAVLNNFRIVDGERNPLLGEGGVDARSRRCREATYLRADGGVRSGHRLFLPPRLRYQRRLREIFFVRSHPSFKRRGLGLLSMRALCLAILITLLASPLGAQSIQPAGWDSQIKLREAVDLNPDPHIVEVNIEAKV